MTRELEAIKKYCEDALKYCDNCTTLDCDNCIHGDYQKAYSDILNFLNGETKILEFTI